eukprot:6212486-Pleurochrysis_carterae.AAC.3
MEKEQTTVSRALLCVTSQTAVSYCSDGSVGRRNSSSASKRQTLRVERSPRPLTTTSSAAPASSCWSRTSVCAHAVKGVAMLVPTRLLVNIGTLSRPPKKTSVHAYDDVVCSTTMVAAHGGILAGRWCQSAIGVGKRQTVGHITKCRHCAPGAQDDAQAIVNRGGRVKVDRPGVCTSFIRTPFWAINDGDAAAVIDRRQRVVVEGTWDDTSEDGVLAGILRFASRI